MFSKSLYKNYLTFVWQILIQCHPSSQFSQLAGLVLRSWWNLFGSGWYFDLLELELPHTLLKRYWLLIGPDTWSRDLNTGLWLVNHPHSGNSQQLERFSNPCHPDYLCWEPSQFQCNPKFISLFISAWDLLFLSVCHCQTKHYESRRKPYYYNIYWLLNFSCNFLSHALLLSQFLIVLTSSNCFKQWWNKLNVYILNNDWLWILHKVSENLRCHHDKEPTFPAFLHWLGSN